MTLKKLNIAVIGLAIFFGLSVTTSYAQRGRNWCGNNGNNYGSYNRNRRVRTVIYRSYPSRNYYRPARYYSNYYTYRRPTRYYDDRRYSYYQPRRAAYYNQYPRYRNYRARY